MFLVATLALNPSDPTEFVASGSDESQLEEHETFSTSRILQQLVLTMKDCGITDAALLSRDGQKLYEDWDGEDDDLTKALREFARQSTAESRESFQTLRLVLDHRGTLLSIVVDVRVTRVHEVDMHPIEIRLAGFLRVFRADDELSEEMLQLLDRVFESQDGYQEVCVEALKEFRELVDSLQAACRKHLDVDWLETDCAMRIIEAPRNPAAAIAEWPRLFDHTSVSRDDVLYCYLWHQIKSRSRNSPQPL